MPFESLEPQAVADWMAKLPLHENYSRIVLNEEIDGIALIFMAEEWEWTEWADFGFVVRSDVLKIKCA